MKGTNTTIKLQLHIWRARILCRFRARLFLATYVVWETSHLCNQVKARIWICCYMKSLVLSILLYEKNAILQLFGILRTETLQQSPPTLKSETLFSLYRKEKIFYPWSWDVSLSAYTPLPIWCCNNFHWSLLISVLWEWWERKSVINQIILILHWLVTGYENTLHLHCSTDLY